MLPYKYKIAGFICIALATVLTAIYFYYGPGITIPVFAVVSSYIETKVFAIFKTNFFEELTLIIYIGGFSLVVFSKEKNEKLCLKIARLKALKKTILTYILWMLLTVIFVFGNAYIATLLLNIIIPFIIYLIHFNVIKRREIKKARLRNLQKKLANSIS